VMNFVLVPHLAHAALTLSIGLGAMVNALSLLVGLRLQGKYQPQPGWPLLMAQVLAASAVFGGLLWYAAGYWDWTGLQLQAWSRVGLMTGVTSGSVVVYFAILKGLGVDLRALWRH